MVSVHTGDADARTPVLVGAGQITQRPERGGDPRTARGPLPLMVDAARAAAADAGPATALLAALQAVVVIRLFADTSPRFVDPAGRFTNLPRSVAQRLGAEAAQQLVYTHPGGNMPQWSINRLAEQVAAGRLQAALVVGAEALATWRMGQRAQVPLGWHEDAGGTPEAWGDARRGWSDVENAHGARAAIVMYPMFENAIRHHLGRSIGAHQAAMGRWLEPFAKVAAANPLADRRAGFDAAQIATPGPDNPWIGWPYTRLMSANAYIDQGAAVILTSVALARALGVPEDRWVFLHGCADAHDHWHVSQRRDFHSAPAMAAVFEQAFAMAGKQVADMRHLDIYSCFSSAVAVAYGALGLQPDDPRGLTVTGGLPYFGGPGNNYVTHAIAQMMQVLRGDRASYGLVTANGNYLTKHSAGIYSTERPSRAFAPEPPSLLQSRLNASIPSPVFAALAAGEAVVETYTVMHERSGPSAGVLFGRLLDGTRFIANTPVDASLFEAMQAEDFIGRRGVVTNDGVRNVWAPR
ncbi:thiolase C-terminal domain-containing protein [Aquabacterium sp. OR-4]|uniref:thiolase C-terminal domain-containing protein n=1 Tax=Aquabacterium sp. OR-4 TaxID=2978127 RepID=UPI0021B263ED|nr:acetyl-CoA acetyltransferase [Aquabacterium sp. OR-4]MDT7837260.1 acetyl-CoA acetyltransferase [Aquabacterium sp. OR-4]